MKRGSLLLPVLLTICSLASAFVRADAQDSIELPEIKSGRAQEYQDLRIEVVGIKRMPAYQPYWYKSERVRGAKIVAEPGFEVAVIFLRTTRLGANRGININRVSVYDASDKRYEADLVSIHSLGSRSDSPREAKEQDYEFPVIVPKNVRFSAVQLQEFKRSETRPFFVFQTLTFDVSEHNW